MSKDGHALAERFDTWSVTHPQVPVLRVLFRVPTVLWRLGLGPLLARFEVRGGHLVMLTVRGRTSGRPRHTPVTAHTVDGRTYLWCPYGKSAQWFRNVTADPLVTVQAAGGPRAMRAVPVAGAGEALEVVDELRRFDDTFLHSYLGAEGVTDTPEEIVRNWQRLHLRRLDPTDAGGPPALTADLVWLWPVAGVAAAVGLRSATRNRKARNREDRRTHRKGTT